MTVMEQEQSAGEKDTGRLEAFSDGVFSIAMTLLVLELKVPNLAAAPSGHALWAELGRQWPGYLSFVTSFFTVLIMWVNHHGIFRLVRRTDAPLLFANGILLFLVTAVPFPTALVATYLRTPAASAACAVYAGLFVFISLAYGLLLLAASRGDRLLVAGARGEIRRRVRDCFAIGVPLYLAACVSAPFSAWLSLGICSGLWVFWAVGTMERCSSFGR
jgi:uncharacterized membrane protein